MYDDYNFDKKNMPQIPKNVMDKINVHLNNIRVHGEIWDGNIYISKPVP